MSIIKIRSGANIFEAMPTFLQTLDKIFVKTRTAKQNKADMRRETAFQTWKIGWHQSALCHRFYYLHQTDDSDIVSRHLCSLHFLFGNHVKNVKRTKQILFRIKKLWTRLKFLSIKENTKVNSYAANWIPTNLQHTALP